MPYCPWCFTLSRRNRMNQIFINFILIFLLMGLSFLLLLNFLHRQVVGWPPLRTYRMNNFNSHAKSPVAEVFNSMVEESKSNIAVDSGSDNNNMIAKEKGNLKSSLFVKVNKDGIPIGRKVDLSVHSSYETLAQTLEDMFNEPTTVITCKGEFFLVFILLIKKMLLLYGIMSCF